MIRRALQALLDALIPLSGEAAIARALSEETLSDLMHPIVHRDLPWITALFPYRNHKVRALIRAIKYRGEKAPLPALGHILGDEITDFLSAKRVLDGWQKPLLIPVPSSPERLRARGYNQAERIAIAIIPSVSDAIEYAPDILARADRPSQVSVSKAGRAENVRGSFFMLRPDKVAGRNVILIDDVAETGMTLWDARRALHEGGAGEVAAFTVAH